MQARNQIVEQTDRLPVEELRKDMAIEVAQIRADADKERADKDLEIARTRADSERVVAEGLTQRTGELYALISSSLARIGAVVIVILLVRIFLRDRQRFIMLAGFYFGLAEASEISQGDPEQFKEWLARLTPPLPTGTDDILTPVEGVMKAMVELAKLGKP